MTNDIVIVNIVGVPSLAPIGAEVRKSVEIRVRVSEEYPEVYIDVRTELDQPTLMIVLRTLMETLTVGTDEPKP